MRSAPPRVVNGNARGFFAPLLITATVVAGAGVLFFFDPAVHNFYPICYLRAFTGLNCPGCGSLRAMHQLLHGHVVEAARLNLLFVLSLPFAAWAIFRSVMDWLGGQAAVFGVRPVWMWTFLGVSAVFTVLRNLPGFEWLAP